MSASRQFNRPIENASALASTHNSNTIANLFTTGGNVGIGKTAPSSALDVVGNILSTGSIDAGTQFLGQALDSSTGPSFSWTGDTNTGIYRPVVDTLGFVTNGTERIRVTSSGNVGIGTTAPSYKLDVNENVNVFSSFNQNVLISPENGPRIYFGTKTDISAYMICGAYSSVNNIDTKNRPIIIFNSSGNTLFYGATSGNVGIGTTIPSANLEISSTNVAVLKLNGDSLNNAGFDDGRLQTQFQMRSDDGDYGWNLNHYNGAGAQAFGIEDVKFTTGNEIVYRNFW